MTKKCYKCKEVKPLDGFNRCKKKKDGRQSMCRGCQNQYSQADKEAKVAYDKKRYQDNKEAIAEKAKQYNRANKEAIAERGKQYREANKEAIAERGKQYREANKEAIAVRAKKYYQANKEAHAERGVQYMRERRKTDPIFRLSGNIRNSIRQSLINGGYSKTSQTHEILGCSYEEYHQHIEAQFVDGMSWQRLSEIHIDHRLPLSAATTEAELLALNHHRNLQPLWKSDNLAKGSSYCPKELAAYFKKHL